MIRQTNGQGWLRFSVHALFLIGNLLALLAMAVLLIAAAAPVFSWHLFAAELAAGGLLIGWSIARRRFHG